MRLDAEIDHSIISSITTKEGTDMDDLSSLSSNGTSSKLGGRRTGSKNNQS